MGYVFLPRSADFLMEFGSDGDKRLVGSHGLGIGFLSWESEILSPDASTEDLIMLGSGSTRMGIASNELG